MGNADQQVLEFAAAHRLVVAGQVGSLLGEDPVEAGERLVGLERAGLAASDRVDAAAPAFFRITSAGLRTIGSRLPAPGFDPCYQHALSAGWLWLIASAGRLGSVEGVLSERQMRAEDREGGPEAPFDVRPGEFGGRGEVHYPDLMLFTGSGRVAVELLLAPAGQRDLGAVLRAYGADARVHAVLVLVGDPRVGRLVQSVAGKLELTSLVRVQMARSG